MCIGIAAEHLLLASHSCSSWHKHAAGVTYVLNHEHTLWSWSSWSAPTRNQKDLTC